MTKILNTIHLVTKTNLNAKIIKIKKLPNTRTDFVLISYISKKLIVYSKLKTKL